MSIMAEKEFKNENLKHYVIYKIVDNETQKAVYVGQTTKTLRERFYIHCTQKGKAMYEPISLHGKDNFSIVAIDESNSKKEALLKEAFWTLAMSQDNHLYNDDIASIPSQKHRDKLSRSNIGKHNHKGCNNPMFGKRFTDDEKMRMSSTQKRKKVLCVTTGEVFEGIGIAARKYNVHSANISNCCKGRCKSTGNINGEKLVWEYYV